MLVGLSLSAYRRQRLSYIYDRCFLESSFVSGVFPVSVCPEIRCDLSFSELTSLQLISSSKNVVLILFRLFFGLVGFENTKQQIVSSAQKITSFFYASLNLAEFRYSNAFVFFLSLFVRTVNPLFVVQSALVNVKACSVGFEFLNVRFDRFAHLSWLEVVYSFVAAGTFFGRSVFCYDRFFLFSLSRLFLSQRASQNVLLPLTTGLRPKFFDYERVVQGLSFKLVYRKSKKFRKIC